MYGIRESYRELYYRITRLKIHEIEMKYGERDGFMERSQVVATKDQERARAFGNFVSLKDQSFCFEGFLDAKGCCQKKKKTAAAIFQPLKR